MALQMPVYREISAIESKVFMGHSWRQLCAIVLLTVVCGGLYFMLWVVVGLPDNLCMYIVFVPGVPIAAWGWWRPKGLLPEKYLGYVVRHYLGNNLYLLGGRAQDYRTSARPSIKERTR
ncbi:MULTISPECIES: PrgI family protein [Bifidobacterium]|uniref:PrgI family protein n=2 Tax=Bifidobacterium TaxID=1678 RepID=A0A261FPI4_9BIFI|nr:MULTISPECIES: PrgI family protein [Bifidobacterium]OZG60726.1 PrgI family protein [Bifidobacterium lemurum]OZG69624.1 PrgI family protein [Bifidobacterium eulemuris]QOL32261.1 PrgI family protein [Bifidobacterium eulemuris]QOL35221.1 PrgI family protein [Bifidobacterium lemurum]